MKLKIKDQKKCYSSMHPNLYVEYGNMIHFSRTAMASMGWLDMGRITVKFERMDLAVIAK